MCRNSYKVTSSVARNFVLFYVFYQLHANTRDADEYIRNYIQFSENKNSLRTLDTYINAINKICSDVYYIKHVILGL